MTRMAQILMTILCTLALGVLVALFWRIDNAAMTFSWSWALIGIIAVLHGVTMKIADLLDEHGMVWMKGLNMWYGVLWGGFASLLVIADAHLANAFLAMTLAFLVRLLLDHRNHAVAGAIIIITFLASSQFIPTDFSLVFVGLAALGMLKDHIGNVRIKRDVLYKLNELAPYSILVSLAYSALTDNWIVFFAFTISTASYSFVKFYFLKRGWYARL